MADTSDGPVRTAIIGYGQAGSRFHAPFIAATDGLAVTAVVTGNDERAGAARQRHPGAAVLPTVEHLLRRRQEVDLVVVASPNNSHVPVGLAVLAAGLPVVIDKPVAPSVAGAVELKRAAERNGLLLAAYHNRRWDGDFRTLRSLLARDALGTVHRFESRFERWRPRVNAAAWRERAGAEVAGGLLYDLGSHLIDQALVLFGPVADVYAELGAVRPGALVDDDVFVALTHASGVRSHLWASSVAADAGPRFRVLGTSASYVKHGLDVQERSLREGTGSPGTEGWGLEPESAWGLLGTPDDVRPVPTERGEYQAFYAGVRDALRTGAPPPVTIDQAIEVLALIDAARRSAAEGVTVRHPS